MDNKNITPVNSHATMGVTQEQHADAQNHFAEYMREISRDKFHPDDISNKAGMWFTYTRDTIHPEKTIDTVSKQPTIYDTFKPQTREQLQTPYENANPELNFALKHGISILDPSKNMEAYERAHLLGLKREKLDLPRGKDGTLNLGRIQHDLNKSKNLQHEANMSGAVTDYSSMSLAVSAPALIGSSGLTASYAAVKEMGLKGALNAGLSNAVSQGKTFFGSRLTQASAGLTGVGVGAKVAGVDNDITDTMGALGKTGLVLSGAGIFFNNLMKANSRFGVSNTPLHATFAYQGATGAKDAVNNLSDTYSNFKSGKTGGFKSFLKALPEVADLGISALMLSSASHFKPNIGKTHIPGPVRQNIKNNSNRVEIDQNAPQSPKFEVLSKPSTEPNLIKSDGPATPRNPYEAFIINNEIKAATKYFKEFGKPLRNSKKTTENSKPVETAKSKSTTEPVPETSKPVETAKPDTQVKNETRTADEVRKFEKDNEIAEDIEPTEKVRDQDKSAEDAAREEQKRKEREEREKREEEERKRKEEERKRKEEREEPKEDKKEDKKEEPKEEPKPKEEKKEEKLTAKQKATAAALGALGSLFGGNGDSRGGLAQGFSNSLGHGLPEQSAPSYERTQTNLHFISEMGM